MDDTQRVALYARVSSQKQASGTTIRSQVAALRERIATDGFHLDEECQFLDDGFSGGTLVRPALERLRDLAWSGGLDRLYVHSPDRLARNYAHQMVLLEEFARQGVTIVFLNDDARRASPEGALLVQMQGMIAEYERAKILERTRRGRRFAAREGKVSAIAHAPFGYRYVPKHAGDGEARYDVVLAEARVVRDVFQWVGVEGLSLGRVAARLLEQGVLTPKGNPRWDRATLRGMLLNPAYTGTARYGKTRLFPRKTGRRAKRGDPPTPRREKIAQAVPLSEQEPIAVPALVSSDLFAAVAERLAENRRVRERHAGAELLLSGLLVCHRCGSAYCGRRHRYANSRSPYVYYRCLGAEKHRHGGESLCDNPGLNGALLEQAVWRDVCGLLEDPTRLRREFERRLQEPQADAADVTRLQQSLTQLKRRQARLLDAYEQGWIERTEFQTRAQRLREQLRRDEELLTQRQRDEDQTAELRLIVDDFAGFAERLTAGLSDADFATQRRLLKLLIKRIEVDHDDVRIVYRVHPPPFAHRPASSQSERGVLQDCIDFHSPAQGCTRSVLPWVTCARIALRQRRYTGPARDSRVMLSA